MTRKLRPCGTQSAYRRHLNRGETPCDACRAANNARFPAGALKAVEADMADALEANPPVIEWAKNRRGVFHAVYINDPFAEREAPPRTDAEQERHRVKNEKQRQRRLQERECTDPELLAAGTRDI